MSFCIVGVYLISKLLYLSRLLRTIPVPFTTARYRKRYGRNKRWKMSSIFVYIIRFLALVVLQVLVLNNFQIFGFLNPKVYILFILLLPQKTHTALTYFLAFALGITIDMFENTGGIHASATLFLAFVRPVLFRLIIGSGNSEIKSFDLKYLGIGKFLIYVSSATFLHHLWLFTLEAFTFKNYFLCLLRLVVCRKLVLLVYYLNIKESHEKG